MGLKGRSCIVTNQEPTLIRIEPSRGIFQLLICTEILKHALHTESTFPDRTENKYGVEVAGDAGWKNSTCFYKNAWREILRLKVGIPPLYLGNIIFPQSHIFICEKVF